MDPTTRKILRGTTFALLLIVAFIIAAAAWLTFSPRQVPTGQPPLVELTADKLPSFRQDFNASGEVRVLVMLSPT